MEKILISTNKDKVTSELDEISSLMANAHNLNDYLKENLNKVLTKDILVDVIENGGQKLISDFRSDQEAKLNKAGVIGITKKNLMVSIDEQLKEDLIEIRSAFFKNGSLSLSPKTGLAHVSFNKEGEPQTIEGHEIAILEKHSIYASTKEHFELYNTQVEAVASINKLIEVTKKHLPAATFVNAQLMYSTFFEYHNTVEKVEAKPLNYKMF